MTARTIGLKQTWPVWLRVLTACCGIVLVAALTIAGYTAVSIYSYACDIATAQADAAIVLGAAGWGTRPSPVLRERLNHAAALYSKGLVRTIVLTGGKQKPAEARIGEHYLRQQGLPARAVLVEERSASTEQNLLYGSRLASQHQLLTYLVVSDPLHMKRAMTIARDLELNAAPSPTPTSMYRSWHTKSWFLARETACYLWYRTRALTGLPEPLDGQASLPAV